jgi:hypothetical protein
MMPPSRCEKLILKVDLCFHLKKVITITVLVVFLLNAVGLYGVLIGLQFRFASEANKELDENRYTASEAITFQVPLAIPYSSDEQDFQRVTGEFEHEGEVYRLVKQKLHRDTLYIVCIKDTKSKKINQALADYVKTFTDRPFNAKPQSGKVNYSLIKDFLNTGIEIESDSYGWSVHVSYVELSHLYLSSFTTRIKYPPKPLPPS